MWEKVKVEWIRWTRLTPTNALYDRTLLWLFVGLLVIGFIAVSSASISLGASEKYNDPFHFAVRDGGYVIASLLVFSLFIQIPSEKWERYNIWIFASALFLLLVVLVVGKNINGAVRWISLGPVNFQPAELAKLAIICYMSSFCVRKFDEIQSSHVGFLRPTAVLALFGILLMYQPDLGSSIVLFLLTFSILFIMGARIPQFIVVGVSGAVLGFLAVITSEYRLKRVDSFMDPFSDAYGDGYQLSNAQMAFGQGELWGRGLGNSVQKLEYLPEAHTDFVTAVLGEEFGFIGVLFLLLLLVALTFRVLKISRESLLLERRFNGFFTFGIGVWIFVQGFVNLGAACGLIPTKGLTFPLISYGGSSLVIMSIAIAAVVRIDYENRLARLGHTYSKEDD